jgi:hypothetical protein
LQIKLQKKMKITVLKPSRKRRLSAAEYLKLAKRSSADIKSVVFRRPVLGRKKDFGYFEVEL